jgi:hypothetical protein
MDLLPLVIATYLITGAALTACDFSAPPLHAKAYVIQRNHAVAIRNWFIWPLTAAFDIYQEAKLRRAPFRLSVGVALLALGILVLVCAAFVITRLFVPWSFVAYVIALVVGFAASPIVSALAMPKHGQPKRVPPGKPESVVPPAGTSSPGSRPPLPRETMGRVARHMTKSLGMVNSNASLANRILTFVGERGLYHKRGTLAFMLDPNIHAVLAAHALCVVAKEEGPIKLEPIIWETYRSTIANRLAERRFRAAVEAMPELRGEGSQSEQMRPFLELIQGGNAGLGERRPSVKADRYNFPL